MSAISPMAAAAAAAAASLQDDSLHDDSDDCENEQDCDQQEGVIRPIEAESVQRIVAGQAVTDLASAVKELVDNALDAGSQSINIRLFNQGLDIVEVSDDGSGVPAASRAYMAHPHATSKIRAFEDIYTSSSSNNSSLLGFRGEALFCLANLSEKLVVATRTAEEPVGQQMEYRHDGSLNLETIRPIPRKVGTTVAVVKLLSALPVRRSDMMRRMSQQRSKLMRLMEGYAIFSVGVRLNLMDMVGKKENTLLATTLHSSSIQQTVSSVLGSKFLASLTPISIDLTAALPSSSQGEEYKLEGLISKSPTENVGGAAAKAGQQYFSINGRPVDLPKIARILGEVWRTLGGKKKPSCVLTLKLPNHEYDVNLSPEKRQVMLTHEAELSSAIQAGVTELWNSQTQGQFTPSAASSSSSSQQPLYSQSTLLKTDDNDAATSSSGNRKRSREDSSTTQSPSPDNELDYGYGEPDHKGDGDNDEVECGSEERAPKRMSYYQKQREEQEAQMTLNAAGNVDCQYGADQPTHQSLQHQQQSQQQQPEADPKEQSMDEEMSTPERRRVRRRGGFVHDISTAKQFERPPPTPIDEHFTMPPMEGEEERNEDAMDTEDEDDDEASSQQLAKKRPAEDPSPVPTESKTAQMMIMSSRRVTLTLNSSSNNNLESAEQQQVVQVQQTDVLNRKERKSTTTTRGALTPQFHGDEQQHVPNEFAAAITTHRLNQRDKESTPSDDDRRLWIEAQARFNQRSSSPDNIDMLVKSSGQTGAQAALGTPQVTPNTSSRTGQQDRHIVNNETTENTGPTFSLAQFACSTAGTSTSLVRNHSKKCQEDNVETRTTPGKSPAMSNKRASAQQPEHMRKRSAKPTPTDKAQTSEHNSPTISASSDCQEAWEEEDQESEDCTVPMEESAPDIVWGSFQGTEQVVSMAKAERNWMHARKRKLKEARPASHSMEYEDDGSNGTDMDTKKKICLSKGDFAGMTVLGQFNLGFILAKDPKNHLWILDQHACDERYNFEKLMAETVIHEQKLIAPMPLELDPSEESCIMDHMEIFEKNGFRFNYDADKPPRHRLALTALPHSGARDGRKAVQFGKEDVSALCAVLGGHSAAYEDDDDGGFVNDGGTGTDGNGLYGNNAVRRYASSFSQVGSGNSDSADKVITRLPKAVAMFASRACRSSIMIGTALSNKEMEKVVKRLDDLKDPWNCAHGRPTMTHISDLHPGFVKDERRAAEHISGPTVTVSMTQAEEDEEKKDLC